MQGHGADHPAVKVVAVLVAYQRAALLRAALDALAAQTRRPDTVLVIDNASHDGSAEVARAHPLSPDVIALHRNTGGAGGFAVGLATAIADKAADLVWLMDDDTIPTDTALAELLKARADYDGDVVALASRVVWTDQRDHPMNTPRPRPGASKTATALAEEVGAYPVRSMSFVSMLVDAAAVRELGLPMADYFLWNDDFEFSTRLLRHGVGLYVAASVVEHRTRVFGGTDIDPGQRFYFEVRNKIWLLTRSSSLSPAERVLYTGATLRRWVRTFATSGDRRTLLVAGVRGLGAGIVRRPRSNVEVLGGLGPSTRAVAAVEGRPVADPEPLPPGASPEAFSVLMPVYAGDRAKHITRAFQSVANEQTLPPDQIVVVQDGPVRDEVAQLLATLSDRTEVPVTFVHLDTNRGLAAALQAGLAACKHDIVARADADDISLPQRFAVQVPLVRHGYDLVGSAITEFADNEEEPGVTRVQPLTQDAIGGYARFHDPFNHPSVVYRKRAVEAAEGYEHLALMEDYLLFARMIAHGARVRNVPESLVLYRVGAGAYARRGGRALLRSEIKLQRQLRAERFTSRSQFLRNVVIRGGYRLAPESVRRVAYRSLILARRGARST